MQRSLGIVAALIVALAGCGGDDESSPEPSGAQGQKVNVAARDFAFDPSSITLNSVGNYTFELTNEGGTTHALEIEGNGVEEETSAIGPGEKAEVTVELAAGTYDIYCPIDGHRDQGMEGTLTVGG